ncbi:hypothetical protein NMG60_11017508 [Bertholletia excelsa]
MKKLFSIFIITLLLLQVLAEDLSLHSTVNNDEGGVSADLHKKYHPKKKIDCNAACSRRCSKASRKKVCKRACKSCCMRCNCVPPGTYGNKNACPCYASLKTHGHKPKCP